jgi:hypothetical protein
MTWLSSPGTSIPQSSWLLGLDMLISSRPELINEIISFLRFSGTILS